MRDIENKLLDMKYDEVYLAMNEKFKNEPQTLEEIKKIYAETKLARS